MDDRSSPRIRSDPLPRAQVAAYCARHLAQEGHLKEKLDEDELMEKKSTKVGFGSLPFRRRASR